MQSDLLFLKYDIIIYIKYWSNFWNGGNILMQYLCAGYDRLSDADNKNDESSSIQSQKMIIDSFAKFNNLMYNRR